MPGKRNKESQHNQVGDGMIYAKSEAVWFLCELHYSSLILSGLV